MRSSVFQLLEIVAININSVQMGNYSGFTEHSKLKRSRVTVYASCVACFSIDEISCRDSIFAIIDSGNVTKK